MRVGGQRHAPAALAPGKTRYPLYRRLGGPQGRSGQVRKIWSPPGFDPRTVQPVASRYTDYVIPAHQLVCTSLFLCTCACRPWWHSAVLQIGTSLVRFHLVSLEFFIDIKSFRSHHGPGVDSACNRNEYQEHFLGVKAVGA